MVFNPYKIHKMSPALLFNSPGFSLPTRPKVALPLNYYPRFRAPGLAHKPDMNSCSNPRQGAEHRKKNIQQHDYSPYTMHRKDYTIFKKLSCGDKRYN
jgi:hypothetical protein